MKKILSILLILCMLALVGCEKLIDLDNEEVEEIAQGSAWLLLKHDKTYGQKLVTPTPTPTPRPTFTPTPTPTPKVKPTVTPDPDNPTPTESGKKPDSNEKAFAELKEVIGLEDISFEYGGFDLYDNYEFDSVSVEPQKSGNKLMIARILIRNNGTKAVTADFLAQKFDIQLDAGDSKYLSPVRSLISNDFCLLNTNIGSGEVYESVLVFEVKKDFNPPLLNLFITKADKTVILKLK